MMLNTNPRQAPCRNWQQERKRTK